MLTTDLLCKWPITFLEEKLHGICSGDLITIACDSGVGKSTLSRLITRSAREQNCPVVLYSLENRPDTFVTEEVLLEYMKETGDVLDMRQFEIEHTKDPSKFLEYRQKVFEQDQKQVILNGEMRDLLVVHEQVTKGDWNIFNLIKLIKTEIEQGYRLFVIDHLDVLIQRDELSDTKAAMDNLWALVQEHNICVIAFSQIVKKCTALCPSYDDLRGHKAKVYKSTIIITLGKHEYGYYNPPNKYPKAKPTYMRIAKSRSTETACAICFYFAGGYLDNYLDVLCDTPGNFIDGMTREKLQKYKQKKDEQQW